MKRKQKQPHIKRVSELILRLRMQAIEVSARLPESEPVQFGQMGGSYVRPGKSAEKVVLDATKLMAFVEGK